MKAAFEARRTAFLARVCAAYGEEHDAVSPLAWAVANNDAEALSALAGIPGALSRASTVEGEHAVGFAMARYAASALEALLAAGFEPNARTSFGAPSFFRCARADEGPRMLSALAKAGADLSAVDAAGRDILIDAVEEGDLAYVEAALPYAVKGAASRRGSALSIAFVRGEYALAEKLVELGHPFVGGSGYETFDCSEWPLRRFVRAVGTKNEEPARSFVEKALSAMGSKLREIQLSWWRSAVKGGPDYHPNAPAAVAEIERFEIALAADEPEPKVSRPGLRI